MAVDDQYERLLEDVLFSFTVNRDRTAPVSAPAPSSTVS